MDFLLPVAGLMFAGIAVWLAFSSSGVVKAISTGASDLSHETLRVTRKQTVISAGCGTLAGMIQAWEGDLLIAGVWVLFLAIQSSNFGKVQTRLRG